MDINSLKQLLSVFENSSLQNMSYQDKDISLSFTRAAAASAAAVVVSAPIASQAAAEQKFEGTAVVAPLVGSVYRAREPGGDPIVSVGDKVKTGDVLCIIEAMKMLSEVTAPCDGVVLGISFTDGELVEYGASLLTIGEADD